MNRVFITAYSVISSLGIGNEQNYHNLSNNCSTIYRPKESDVFKKPYFPIEKNLGIDEDVTLSAKIALKLLSLTEGKWQQHSPLPLFLATSTGGIKETEEVYLSLKKNKGKFDLSGKNYFYDIYQAIQGKYGEKINEAYTFSTACSASAHAVLHAFRYIKNGIIDKAIVMAVDALSITTMFGFDSLKLVSENGTNPLSLKRDGLSLGEGGAVFLLESEPSGEPIAEIIGAYSNSDGFHITSPSPDGEMQIECIKKAIEIAGIDKNEIDYINAHGTGTMTNDEIELRAIKNIFEKPVPVTSLKGFIGHTVGSSAAIELALCFEMMKRDKIFQPLNFNSPIEPEYIPEKSIDKKVGVFIKNSFGFGGNNASIIIKNLFG